MKTERIDPISIAKNSYWTSYGGKLFWIIFCLVIMIITPILVWFWAKDAPKTLHDLIFNTPIIGFEVFMGTLLIIFGICPKVKNESSASATSNEDERTI